MPYLTKGFALALDQLTDPTNGINKVLVLTDVYSEAYNLISATLTEYNAATTKINLTTSSPNPTASDVDGFLLEQAPTDYDNYVAELWTDTTIIRVDDGVGYSYWKAYYLTKKDVTFASATATDLGGEVLANNTPIVFDVAGGQLVQEVALYHNNDKICYDEVNDVTNSTDFQYSVNNIKLINS